MNKINYMPIAPISVLKENKFDINGIRTHVMMLAHLCSNSDYLNFYLNTNSKRKFVLLDNGAAEDSQITSIQLMDLALLIKPTVVIAPDTIGNGIDTINKSIKFAEQFKKKTSNIQIMAVPQGNTIDEYLETFDKFNSSNLFDWIGISKFVSVKPYSDRISCLMDLAQHFTFKKPIHMLGCNNPIEISFAKYFYMIKSIDSCIAYLYCSNNNIPLDNSLQKRMNTPKDFFDWKLNEHQILNSHNNIKKIDKLCEFEGNF